MDGKELLQKLQEIKDQLPEDLQQLVIIKTEWSSEETELPPKLQKVIDILKSFTDEERDLLFKNCNCIPDGMNEWSNS